MEFPSLEAYREWLTEGINQCTQALRRQNQLVDLLRDRFPDLPPLDASAILLTRDCYRKILGILDQGPPRSREWRKIHKLQRDSEKHFARGVREWKSFALKHGFDRLVPGFKLPQ